MDMVEGVFELLNDVFRHYNKGEMISTEKVATEINQLYEPQAKKLLLSISKESKRMDGTIYLVPDYTKFREAIKEFGIRE